MKKVFLATMIAVALVFSSGIRALAADAPMVMKFFKYRTCLVVNGRKTPLHTNVEGVFKRNGLKIQSYQGYWYILDNGARKARTANAHFIRRELC